MAMHTTAAAPRLVLVPVRKAAAAPAPGPVRRYRLARLKLPPLPPGTEHLRRTYD
jgi:hypothetical protein